MTRKVVGIVVIALWVLGLAFLYKRNGNHSPRQALAEAGLRVSPETYYFTVEQSGNTVGAASSTVDTTIDRIVAVDFLRIALPRGDTVVKLEARSEAHFTRGMRLRDFVIKAIGDIVPYTLRGVMQEGENQTLRITTTDGRRGRPLTKEIVPERSVFVPTMAPLPLMLKGDPRAGDSVAVSVYDPLSRAVNLVPIRIEADSLFLVPDSAVLDSLSGHWVKAHQSSVRGWKIGSIPPAGVVWVDASGRILFADVPGGFTFSRTSYELSFANFKIDHTPKKVGRETDNQARTIPVR